MKKLLAILVLLAAPAGAIDLTCTVPGAAVGPAELAALCEAKRQELNVRANAWTNDLCASVFLREGLRNGVSQKVVRDNSIATRDLQRTAMTTFDGVYPLPAAATCGDGVIDDGSPPGNLDLGETCDPPGVSCDADCQTIP